jgi:hypothetical protein
MNNRVPELIAGSSKNRSSQPINSARSNFPISRSPIVSNSTRVTEPPRRRDQPRPAQSTQNVMPGVRDRATTVSASRTSLPAPREPIPAPRAPLPATRELPAPSVTLPTRSTPIAPVASGPREPLTRAPSSASSASLSSSSSSSNGLGQMASSMNTSTSSFTLSSPPPPALFDMPTPPPAYTPPPVFNEPLPSTTEPKTTPSDVFRKAAGLFNTTQAPPPYYQDDHVGATDIPLPPKNPKAKEQQKKDEAPKEAITPQPPVPLSSTPQSSGLFDAFKSILGTKSSTSAVPAQQPSPVQDDSNSMTSNIERALRVKPSPQAPKPDLAPPKTLFNILSQDQVKELQEQREKSLAQATASGQCVQIFTRPNVQFVGYLEEPFPRRDPGKYFTDDYMNLNENDEIPFKVKYIEVDHYPALRHKQEFRHYLGGQFRRTISIERYKYKKELEGLSDSQRFDRAVKMAIAYHAPYVAIDENSGHVAVILPNQFETLKRVNEIKKDCWPYLNHDRVTPSFSFAVYQILNQDTNDVLDQKYAYEAKKRKQNDHVVSDADMDVTKLEHAQCDFDSILGWFKFEPHQANITDQYTMESESPGIAIFDSTGAGKTCKVSNLVSTNFQSHGFSLRWVSPNSDSKEQLWNSYINEMCSMYAREELMKKANNKKEIVKVIIEELRNDTKGNFNLGQTYKLGLAKNQTHEYWEIVKLLAAKFEVNVDGINSTAKTTRDDAAKIKMTETVFVVDEFHNVLSEDSKHPWNNVVTGITLQDIYGANYLKRVYLNDKKVRARDLLAHYIFQSYKEGKNSIRFIPISATIMNNNPNDLFWTMNLLHRDDASRVDLVRDNDWYTYIDRDTMLLKQDSMKQLKALLHKNTTYAPANKDPRKFAQKLISDVIKVPLLSVHCDKIIRRVRRAIHDKKASVEDIYNIFYDNGLMYRIDVKGAPVMPNTRTLNEWYHKFQTSKIPNNVDEFIIHVQQHVYSQYHKDYHITFEHIQHNKHPMEYFAFNQNTSSYDTLSSEQLKQLFKKGNLHNFFQLDQSEMDSIERQAIEGVPASKGRKKTKVAKKKMVSVESNASSDTDIPTPITFNATQTLDDRRKFIEMFCPVVYQLLMHLVNENNKNPGKKYAICCNARPNNGDDMTGTNLLVWALKAFDNLFTPASSRQRESFQQHDGTKITYTFLSGFIQTPFSKDDFNSFKSNPNGNQCRVIIYDATNREGVDLADVDVLYMIEPCRTRSEFEQTSSRIARMCKSQHQQFFKGIGAITRIILFCATTPDLNILYEQVVTETNDIGRFMGENLCRILYSVAKHNALDYEANKHLDQNAVQIPFTVQERFNIHQKTYYKGIAHPDVQTSFPVIVPHSAVVQAYAVGSFIPLNNNRQAKVVEHDATTGVWTILFNGQESQITDDALLLSEGTVGKFRYYDTADTVSAIFDIARMSSLFSNIDRQIIQMNRKISIMARKSRYTEQEIQELCSTMTQLHKGFQGNHQFMLLIMYGILLNLKEHAKSVDMALPRDTDIFYMEWDGNRLSTNTDLFVNYMKACQKSFSIAFLKVNSATEVARHTNILIYDTRPEPKVLYRIDLLGNLGDDLFRTTSLNQKLAEKFGVACAPITSLPLEMEQLMEARKNNMATKACRRYNLSPLLLLFYTTYYIAFTLQNKNVDEINTIITTMLNDPGSELLTKKFVALASGLAKYQEHIMQDSKYDPELPMWENTKNAILHLTHQLS